MVLTASTAVSKTVSPGSNPGTPATNFYKVVLHFKLVF
jgi:hypothetical protein